MLLTWFSSFFFWLWGNLFFLICVHLLLVYHLAQLSHTCSDLSRLLTVMILETRILFYFILVLLSSTLMKHLTWNVGIISLIHIFGLDIMPFCFELALICFSLNLMVQFIPEFSLSCTNLCKVSTNDGDHVIS